VQLPLFTIQPVSTVSRLQGCRNYLIKEVKIRWCKLTIYFKYVYISTRQKNCWIYKNYPCSKVYILILTVSLSEWSTSVFCFVLWLFLSRLSRAVKLSYVLQKNPSVPANYSVFQHLLHIWTDFEPFPAVMNLRSIVHISIYSNIGLRNNTWRRGLKLVEFLHNLSIFIICDICL